MCLPGVPCHAITWGNNRQAYFYSQSGYRVYLECFHDALDMFYVHLHAYALMTNHVHLLMTPQDETGISTAMQSIDRRYVQYINES